MSDHYERKLLDNEKIIQARSLVTKLRWSHGVESYGYEGPESEDDKLRIKLQTKNNFEATGPITERNTLDELIHSSLENDNTYLNYTCPWYSGKPIYSKMGDGGYFRSHHDHFTNGHYSTTVFLNEPDEYEGGELVLSLGGGIKKFKLPAGHAITYTTGTPHEVTEVTSGLRYVAVFWTKSIIPDTFMRELYSDISKVMDLFPDIVHSNISDALKDPNFLLKGMRNKIKRHYSSDGMY